MNPGVTVGTSLRKVCVLQIADSREFESSRTNPVSSAPVNLRAPVPQKVKGSLPKRRGERAHCGNDVLNSAQQRKKAYMNQLKC